LLEGGLDWKAMGLSPKEMDWIKGKDVSAREIALAYGVPAQLVGIPDSQTFANMREARLALWEDTVVPLLDRAIDTFNAWAMQWWPELRVRFDLDGVPALALRRERKAEGLERLVGAGILTRNEARAELGFGDIAGGDALAGAAPTGAQSRTMSRAGSCAMSGLRESVLVLRQAQDEASTKLSVRTSC
jgi:HK97 family phage portal protein